MIKYFKMKDEKFIEISTKDAEKMLENGENLIIRDIKEEKELPQEKENRISSFFKKIKTNIKSVFIETKEEIEGNTKGNKKTEELLKVLPYMKKRDIHKLVESIVKSPESYKYVKIDAFIPFLDTKDLDKLFLKALKDGNTKIYSDHLFQSLSEKCLSEVVTLYLDELIDIDIDLLYPYLNPKDVNRIVEKMIKK